ncbi:TonB-dependent receptor domain-containing protein [Novosphingobium album (ex Liu et al. 2023)]|uniref:TonB-dependent receptor n=1 Tax=Novosphingobium album (ex Liu et al. 2023) TaxID=3031130 RepID=A0ABT5WNU5_9SPHN|nr:TonB-dependent receptor [Novosphingobium album (ex Liu et al. 2023)]MDE8651713.1 TonB-dependent receptor [Novosphingobium album (ex Liu et al. 2023)]
MAIFALGAGLCAAPAFAQSTPGTSAEEDDSQIIIVTGSILRRTDTETPSPVTVLSADNMQQRGINTAAEALQRLSANGSGTISEGWNNGNNFAAGANAVSLRGLTVQKTLTVFDGMRMAPYPVADDGHRNFVDLNTIPDAVIDRIEVLKDGASATYGADAVAGVVNVITKKQVTGIHLNASGGLAQKGDGGEQRLDLTAGYGDLDTDGFNVYISGMYRKNDEIWARNRDYPWNSGDLSGICNDAGSCMAIPTRWYTFGVNANGSLGGSTIPLAPIVAPATATGTRNGVYQLLNGDCGAFGGSSVVLPATAAGTTYAPSQCQADMKKLYATIRPETERYGFAGRATARIGDKAEAYVSFDYMHTHTYTQLTPTAWPANTPPPSPATWTSVVLPVYVCSAGTATFVNNVNVSSGCDATNGVLNPNNPFAASGQNAIIRARYDKPQTVETNARALRAQAGIAGSFGSEDDWHYNVDFTASEVRLTRISDNYLIPQRLADVIADGSYNFAQPWLNSQEVRDYVAPRNSKVSTSKLWQAQATLSRALFALPGGDVQAAVGLSYRKESINDDSANPENLTHPYDRYFTINAVGAVGSRNVKSAFYEVSAPVLDQLEIDASGRYDKYSSGQKNFSPKFGVKFKPIEQLVLRGTWSKGFRIPSFNEAYGLPTTGYTTTSINCETYADFCASHGNNTYATGQYSLGRTSIGNPALDSEKSTSWTLGAVFEPIRDVSFTVDYFNIKVKDVISNISAEDQTAALDAYLRTGATDGVAGVIVVPGVADPQNPNARALPGFLQFSFQNADEERVQGIDFGAQITRDFGNVNWFSSFDATYLLKYEVIRATGAVERYDGSLSPCDYTSCSGSPKWRGSWQNTFTMGKVALTATAYYTDGYDLASVDYGGIKGDCENSIGASVVAYQDGSPVKCKIGGQWNVDLSANVKVNDNFSLYANVLNVLGIDPKFDPSAAYSIFQYNPAWGQPNIVGRYFRLGAKVDF